MARLVNLRTFRSLKNPAYRFFWAALLFQMGAMNMQIMARSLLIYRMTGSTMMLGLFGLFGALPMLFLSLFGGVIADRVQKKYVMLAGQTGSAVVSLAIALALTTGYLGADNPGSWWVLAVASVFQGTIQGLMMPSRQAMMPEIVGEEQLLNAVSLSNVGTSATRLLAPAAAGFMIAAFDFQAVYYTMTVLYVLAVLFAAFLPVTSKMSLRGGGAIRDIREGVRYLRGQTTLLLILVVTLFSVLLSMPYMMLMPVFTEDILKVGPGGLGVLMSVSGAGAIIGSITLASLPNKRRGLLLLLSCLVMGLALMAFAASTSWLLSLGVMVFVGVGQTGRMALGNTLVQYYVDDEYRGRVMSIYMMQFGLTSLAVFVAGVLSESLGVQWVIGGFAAGLSVLSLLAIAFLPRMRKLD